MDLEKNVYENGEITVSFNPNQCINAEYCAKGLSQVFRTSVIPWIDLDGASTKRIVKQIKRCPSGALTYKVNATKPQSA